MVPAVYRRTAPSIKTRSSTLWMAGQARVWRLRAQRERPRAAAATRRSPSGRARPKPLYTKAGGEKLAANPLYDFVFLNLEGSYDADAVKAIAEGLRGPGATSRKTLIVRVPAFHEDAAAGRSRIRDVFAAGADGITFPHVQSIDEAKQILAAVRAEEDRRLVAGHARRARSW